MRHRDVPAGPSADNWRSLSQLTFFLMRRTSRLVDDLAHVARVVSADILELILKFR
jgi:hypothetical protein